MVHIYKRFFAGQNHFHFNILEIQHAMHNACNPIPWHTSGLQLDTAPSASDNDTLSSHDGTGGI